VAAIEVKDLVTRIGHRVIHDHLNLTVSEGQIMGLVGETGGGKSVLLETLIGLREPVSGSVRIFGQDPYTRDRIEAEAVRRSWSVLFQSGALFSNLTVLENVAFVAREQGRLPPELASCLAAIKIQDSGLSADSFHLMPSQLSGGMRKRAALARALVLDPRLLFLDEPTSGLDPVEAAHVDALVRDLCTNLGLTALLITHDLDTLYAVCDEVAVLAEQRIIAVGTIDQLKQNPNPWIVQYFLGQRGMAAFRAHQIGATRSGETRGGA
jgi:phospholipid/cholesterol/gamma-HCH transport system ATP-binding protein